MMDRSYISQQQHCHTYCRLHEQSRLPIIQSASYDPLLDYNLKVDVDPSSK